MNELFNIPASVNKNKTTSKDNKKKNTKNSSVTNNNVKEQLNFDSDRSIGGVKESPERIRVNQLTKNGDVSYFSGLDSQPESKKQKVVSPQMTRYSGMECKKMDVDMNTILGRDGIYNEIKNILNSFEQNHKTLNFKKGIYIYGSPGCGKTRFIIELLNSLNYDVIKYDAGDVRNKSLIDTITSNNISNRNVLHLMNGSIKKIAIVMDEIDGMNNGDKGGITSLIKLIRQKKTKKQKSENVTLNPIICIGNYYIDKKIKELMKVCNVFKLDTPTPQQVDTIIGRTIHTPLSPSLKTKILDYVQGDLVKLNFIIELHKKNPELLNEEILTAIFIMKSYNYDAKKITHSLINRSILLEEHANFMNETDRTIVSLLYHENIVDALRMKHTDSFFEPPHNTSTILLHSIPENPENPVICRETKVSPTTPSFVECLAIVRSGDSFIFEKGCDTNTFKEENTDNTPPFFENTPPIVEIHPIETVATLKSKESKSGKSKTKEPKIKESKMNKTKNKKSQIQIQDTPTIQPQNTQHTQSTQTIQTIQLTQTTQSTQLKEDAHTDCKNICVSLNRSIDTNCDFYMKTIDNICYADYIDRITFQNQIWVFNEMSSLIKTFYNNYVYHQIFPQSCGKFQPEEVRFTKVLTKYSTEYNNQLFIYNFCQELNMDKRDMKAFFQELRLFHGKNFYNQTDKLNQVMELFETLNISKLDVKRMYRFLDKNVKAVSGGALNEMEDNDDEADDSGLYEEL